MVEVFSGKHVLYFVAKNGGGAGKMFITFLLTFDFGFHCANLKIINVIFINYQYP
jgi:hypothetical protein